MEDLRTQQIEALEVAVPYCAKISNALNNLMEELNGHRQPDTDEYMKSSLKFVEGDLLLNDVKPLELEPPMCEGETKREIKDNNEINQCLKEILNTCNSEDEEVDDKI